MKNMIKMLLCTLVIPVFMLTAFSCTEQEAVVPDNRGMSSDPELGLVIADTITYDVVIVNTDPAYTWEAECLKHLNHKALIDNLLCDSISLLSYNRSIH